MKNASRRTLALGLVGAAAAAVAIAVLAGFGSTGRAATTHSASTAARWPSQSLQNVLSLAKVPPAQRAPLFALTDQHGRHVSLAALRGKVVVLEPMDPHCTDICPIVSEEFVIAAQRLGAQARQVVFLGVNVNQYHERPADVDVFSRHHGLDRLANWHFLTGSTAALERVWHAYGISVQPNKSGDVVHSALMWFVDPHGRERWVATPNYDKPQIPKFGVGIASVASHLLG